MHNACNISDSIVLCAYLAEYELESVSGMMIINVEDLLEIWRALGIAHNGMQWTFSSCAVGPLGKEGTKDASMSL